MSIGWFAFAPAMAGADDVAKKSFDIPAGDAVASLKRFSTQSGQQVIFPEDAIEGTQTKAVKGELTPAGAIGRMLAGTSLKAARDAQSGAFAVSRAPASGKDPIDPNGQRAAPSVNSAARPEKSATDPLRPTRAGDDVVRLTPFQVNTERDTGFVAASSLAGARLAGDLKDTPVAYSVITRDFIDALGITNAFDAADWAPNSVKSIAANGGGYGDDVSNAPGTYSVRGAGGGRGQRNFFIYNSPNDSYAVERFDFGRGPNAVLFGNGSLGGVATTTTKQARFDRPFTEIAQGIGSWSNFRTTFDVNRPLGQRFAIRAAGVHGDSGGWRDKQTDEIRAAFLTVSFKLSAHTIVRLEGEYGESWRNQTFSNLSDRLSGWDGQTTFDGRLDTLPANANALGVARRGGGYLVYDPFSGVNAIMNYQNDPITLAGGENAQVPLAGFVQGTLPSFASAGANLLYAYNLPGNRFENAIAGSAFRVPAKSFSLASDAPVLHERFRDIQLTADHRIGDVFLQVAFDLNRSNPNVYNIDVRGSNVMFIDINRALPNGAVNPHFLQPYADGNIRRNVNTRDAEAFRFAAGYVKDAGKWGNYSTNLMGGLSENRTSNKSLNLSIAQNPDRRRWGSSGASLGPTDLVRIRRYWNESSRPYLAPASIRYIVPLTGEDRMINPVWAIENDRSDSRQATKTRYDYAIAAVNAKYFKNRLILLGAVRLDKFYNHANQQVPAGDYDPVTWDGTTSSFKSNAPADWAALKYTLKDASGAAIGTPVAAETRPRDANGNRLAQYAGDRFKDDYNAPAIEKRQTTRSVGGIFHLTRWLSPYANYAETFNPPPAQQRLDSSFLPATVAKGVDLGLRATLLGGRLNVNLIRYKNEEINNAFDPGVQGNINSILGANAVGDLSPGGRNIRGLENVPSVLRDIRDRLAEGYEVEVVANPTRQWRLSFNVGLPKVYERNAFQDAKQYFTDKDATLRQIMADTGALIDANNNASVDTAIPINERSPDVNGAVNAYNALFVSRRNFVDGRRISQDQPSLNFFNDYSIATGRLKGLRVGAGVQYRGKQIIGYRAADTIVNPANPATAIDDPSVDAYSPIFSPASYYTVVATLSYTLRLEKRREIRFDLRVNNLLNDQGPIFGVSTALRPRNGDLTSPARETVPNVYSYKQPTGVNFTTTLKF